VKRSLVWTASLSLAVLVGVLLSLAPAQGQTPACPPGQVRINGYCQVPPPRPPGCDKLTAKLEILRATFNRLARTLSILAPITSLASGQADIQLQAAASRRSFTGPVANSRIRITRSIGRAQARLGTGILTVNYPGDADTRSQVVRLRAANTPADLDASRPVITTGGFLQASGSVSNRARGKVRVQIEFVNGATGQTNTTQFNAPISNGRYLLNVQLSGILRALIAARCGTVHSYTLFTGYLPRRIRGEMRSYQVLPPL
jgi:hypothetical protein